MMLEALHNEIRDRLVDGTRLETVLLYPSGRAPVTLPTWLLELSGLKMGTNPGTEELALSLTWSLRILVDAAQPNAAMTLQTLMIEAAQALYLAPFASLGTPTGFAFDFESPPDGDAFAIGRVSWSQEAHFGTSVWAGGGSLPTTVHVEFKKGEGTKC